MSKRNTKTEQPAERAAEPVSISIVSDRPRCGVFPVKIMCGEDEVLFAGRVNPHKPEEISAFIKRARKVVPAVDADTIRRELLQLAAPGKPQHIKDICLDFEATPRGLIWHKRVGESLIDVPLTNFTAEIIGDVLRDDGAEQTRMMEVMAVLAGKPHTIVIPAGLFGAMEWPIKHLGSKAIVYPAAKDYARTAIQILSPDAVSKTIFTHTGWRLIGGNWIYLHGGGGIGADGPVSDVAVDLAGALDHYLLPEPPTGDTLKQAIQASMRIIGLGGDALTIPPYAAVWRAVGGDCDASIALAGATGVFKSELAALLQQHFGADMDRKHLPGSWRSTANALEGLLFGAKDALTVVDDFAPTGSIHDVARLHMAADHVLRGQGNGAGRGRMNADGSLRPAKPPRGLVLSTGEDVPRGQSLRARMLIVELSKGDIDAGRLTDCQSDARKGRYASAMAGFICFMAGRLGGIKAGLRDEVEQLRARAVEAAAHSRTPEIVANLFIGLKWFAAYAMDAGAMDQGEADCLLNRAWAALMKAADCQSSHQRSEEPTQRFTDLLVAAIASGEAHLADRNGCAPVNGEAWGWRGGGVAGWACIGKRIGWIDGDDVYLEPDASFKAAQSMGDGLTITPTILRKRLAEKGLIVREGRRDELTVRRTLEGQTRKVIFLSAGVLCGEPAKTAISTIEPALEPPNSDLWREKMAGFPPPDPKNPPKESTKNRHDAPETGVDGGNGGNGGFSPHHTPAGDFHKENNNGKAKPAGKRVRVTI